MTCSYCEKPVHARGLCGMHYRRLRLNGSPLRTRRPSGGSLPGPANPNWKGSGVGYTAIHERWRRKERGPCADCGGTANQWSYPGGAADEVVDPVRGAFSPTAEYVPRCAPCHKRFDGRLRDAH